MRSKLRATVWDAEFDRALAASTNTTKGSSASNFFDLLVQSEINTSPIALRALARQVAILH